MGLGSLWFFLIAVLLLAILFSKDLISESEFYCRFSERQTTKEESLSTPLVPTGMGMRSGWVLPGGTTFAAFPNWHATMFSGFYLPLLLILVALILRGMAFEFRSQDENPPWRNAWDWAIVIGSLLPAFLWGVAFANFIKGVPIDQNMQYVGGFWNLLNLYAIFGGLFALIFFTVHGAIFLSLKTDGTLQENSKSAALKLWIPNVIILLVFFIATVFRTDIQSKLGILSESIFIAAIIFLLMAVWLIKTNKLGSAFLFTSGSMAAYFTAIFLLLYPRLMISSLDPLYSLTIANSASRPTTLAAISWVALIF